MSSVESVSRTSTYERRLQITQDADQRQDDAIASVMESGFFPGWNGILSTIGSKFDASNIAGVLSESLHGDEFEQTLRALAINGAGVALYAQRKHDELAGVSQRAARAFAEPTAFTPDRAVAYWQKLLNLTDAQVRQLLAMVTQARNEAARIAARAAAAMVQRMVNLYEQSVVDGLALSSFIQQAREVMPDASRAILETEYRTHLTTVYGDVRVQQMQERVNTFPFAQMMVIKDGRTTWWICLPMGIAGPNGTGYICAANDSLVRKWKAPNHYRCRSDWSPISYREAQRYGILAADGRTKIALVGDNPDRPYGDPPAFAENPNGNGEVRKVEPQEGFAG